MAVTAYVGYMGGGKTYELARVGLQALSEGKTVYNNFGFGLGAGFVDADIRLTISWGEMLRVRQGVLLIDELPILAPSRGWAKWPPALTLLWTQARKFGLEVHYTAQSLDFVDKYARDVTEVVVRCSTLGKSRKVEGAPWLMRRIAYDGREYGRRNAKSLWWKMRTFDPAIGGSYDTKHMVALAGHLVDKQIAAMGEIDGCSPEALALLMQDLVGPLHQE